MASDTHAPGYVPNPAYSQEDWDEVHSPEMTDEQIATARPLVEVMPELVEAMRKRRGPQKAPTKEQIALRVDRDVLETYRSTGPGWQSRMNTALRALAADIKANPGVTGFDIVPGKSMRAKDNEEAEATRQRQAQATHVIGAVQDLAQRIGTGTATRADADRVLELVEDLRGLRLAELDLLSEIIDQAKA